jgi:hypothetical protein
MAAIQYKDIGFAELFFFEHYVIAQLKEGTVLEPANNKPMVQVLEDHYQDQPFIYISNRTYAYNVSPLTYRESSKIDMLKGICIVTSRKLSQDTARFEGKFYDKGFHVCGALEDGIDWALSTLKKAVQDQESQSF